ncbi:hypothetical protein EDB80DRAFT_738465 [Ilyonectria destructans]|nr:hypothetical protein EDB80DRAFT_738465 [Ilyonectria destructans]
MSSTRPGEPVTIENITDFREALDLLHMNPCQTLDRCLLLLRDRILYLPEENQQNALGALVLLAQGQVSRWHLKFYQDTYSKKAKQVVDLVKQRDLGKIRELLTDEYDLPQLTSEDLVRARNHSFNVKWDNEQVEWEQKCLSPTYWSVLDYINQGRENEIWTYDEWRQMQVPLVLGLYLICNEEGGKDEAGKWDGEWDRVPITLARRLGNCRRDEPVPLYN